MALVLLCNRAIETLITPREVRNENAMDFEALLRRIRSEFAEMPGLRLTPAQATKLWGLEREACHRVINALVESSFLRWTADGTLSQM